MNSCEKLTVVSGVGGRYRDGEKDCGWGTLSSGHSSLPYFPGKVTGGLCHWKKEVSGNSWAAQECHGNARAMPEVRFG